MPIQRKASAEQTLKWLKARFAPLVVVAAILGGVAHFTNALSDVVGFSQRLYGTVRHWVWPPQPRPATASSSFTVFADTSTASAIVGVVGAGSEYSYLPDSLPRGWVRVQLGSAQGWARRADISAISEIGMQSGFGFGARNWDVFFTDPAAAPDTTTRYSINARFADAIAHCHRSLDIAIYEINDSLIVAALVDAVHRGVTVRMVSDRESQRRDSETFSQLRHGGIPVAFRGGRGGLMHAKFAIIDGEVVWTGSWNYTRGATFSNNENALVIRSPEVAEAYTTEFARLLGDSAASNRARDPRLGRGRGSVLKGGIGVYFTPMDDVQSVLDTLISDARRSIKFMLFALSSERIANALIERAKNGVRVEGILERNLASRRRQSSATQSLLSSRLDSLAVRLDGNRRFLHHDVLIIDGQWILTGSANMTLSAFTRNEESVIVIPDPALARVYAREFDRLWVKAKPSVPLD